ncbi:hypothetical protein QVD17_17438 [Tagetes erecta]|uniref:F-box domain-containing protein n=1 Tax=Tagetes erecta TaxID=13708 RepID=A0AAD8P1F0_TARER|nr:hypothetical protein QVD17_17438 [Tagetes erecta]
MSDNIPFEMQVEIMKKLPVKSLIQFRSVSKSWKHLIDSSNFITDYTRQHTHTQHLLIAGIGYELKYMLVADDDTFPQHKLHLTFPLLENMLKYPCLLGCSYGLLCLVTKGVNGSMCRAVVLNPCIRKSVIVDVSHVEDTRYSAVVGFGVCRETRDPKLVKVTYIEREVDVERIDCIPRQVEVFTLSGGASRSSYGNLPRKSICFRPYQVVTDGILYFLALDRNSIHEFHMIVSFDLTSEAFREISLPCSLAYGFPNGLSMSKLRESLVVIQIAKEDNSQISVVWMMEDGVPESFTKLFTINTDTPNVKVMGFRKNGELIVQFFENDCKLVVYEAYSRHIDNLRIDGTGFSYGVYPYRETLLLHDQPNLKMFCLGN